MYRLTRKAEAQREKLAAMRRGRDAARADIEPREAAQTLPDLRRQIIITGDPNA